MVLVAIIVAFCAKHYANCHKGTPLHNAKFRHALVRMTLNAVDPPLWQRIYSVHKFIRRLFRNVNANLNVQAFFPLTYDKRANPLEGRTFQIDAKMDFFSIEVANTPF